MAFFIVSFKPQIVNKEDLFSTSTSKDSSTDIFVESCNGLKVSIGKVDLC